MCHISLNTQSCFQSAMDRQTDALSDVLCTPILERLVSRFNQSTLYIDTETKKKYACINELHAFVSYKPLFGKKYWFTCTNSKPFLFTINIRSICDLMLLKKQQLWVQFVYRQSMRHLYTDPRLKRYKVKSVKSHFTGRNTTHLWSKHFNIIRRIIRHENLHLHSRTFLILLIILSHFIIFQLSQLFLPF